MTRTQILLEALADSPADVNRLVARLDRADAERRPAEGLWSMADVIAHLIAVETPFRERFRRILDEDQPWVPSIRLDEPRPANELETAALCDLFAQEREQTLKLLRALRAGDWQRPAVHEETGPTTLRFQVQVLVGHDIEHTSQLAELRAGLPSRQ